jgi:CRISPR-associated exonuclease Cas4
MGHAAMYDEDDLLPLSLLAQLAFCERRAALVYIEQLWEDNAFTAEGRVLHERSHEPGTEVRGGVRLARGLLLRSLRLGVSGKADVVEFHLVDETSPEDLLPQEGAVGRVRLPGLVGCWRVLPIEYKRGRRRHEEGYEIQLCAQALCLEEMLGGAVTDGALYYAETGRRLNVLFDASLRQQTKAVATRLHELVRESTTPPAHWEKKCESCSLLDLCLPKAMCAPKSSQHYLVQAFDSTSGAQQGAT